MDQWITPDWVFDGRDLRAGQAVRLRAGRVAEIADTPRAALAISGILTPGYVDLQVNGGGGVMLNTTPTRQGLATIAAAHRGLGTVAILPTVITDHPDVLDRAADAVIAAKGDPGIAGLHIEGPHISEARRGTHAAKHIRPMDNRTLSVVARLREAAIPVMITVAPENTTPDQIAALSALGAVVSVGHTDANAGDIQAALDAGARCATHLFNAMSPMHGRAPGTVGAVINSDAYAGIICDGHHVADSMVAMAIRARPVPDRMFLVSDAMATVGGPPSFDLYGQKIALDHGRLINQEGSLAGAHVTQAEAVQRLVANTSTSLTDALRMATSNPAGCMGLPALGQLEDRSATDLIVLGPDNAVQGTLAEVLAAQDASTDVAS